MYTQGVNFFKYITPMACTDRLKIPLAHGWNKNKVFPNVVILKDNKGNTWPVKLQKVENQVCFVDAGWLKFVKDNRIEPGHFLMFENVHGGGLNVFSFVVFDPVTAQGFKGLQLPAADHVPSFFELSSSSFPDDDSVNEVEEMISEECTEEVDDDDDDDDDEDDGEEEEDVECDLEEEDVECDLEEEDVECDLEEESPNEPCRGNTSSGRAQQKRVIKDIYGSDIFKSGVIPKPNNPYFVSFIKRNRPNELHVPVNVVKDFGLKLPKKAKIRDTRGIKWEAELDQWKDGRLFYRGGLASFCRVNHVGDDDIFVCEFVYGDGGVQEEDLTLYLYKV